MNCSRAVSIGCGYRIGMKTLKLDVELTYDDMQVHGGDGDQEAKEWFLNAILLRGDDSLHLLSDEIGDVVGEVKILSVK